MNKVVNPQKIAQGIYQIEIPTPFPVGPVNVYLLEGDCLTLVDVGPLTEEAWQTLSHGLKEIGYEITDIQQIVLTHHHVDHFGLLERVRKVSGARTYAHPMAVPYVELNGKFLSYHSRFFFELYTECGVPEESLTVIDKFHNRTMTKFCEKSQIDECLKHEQTLPNMPEWQILYTPGHAQSQISLYRESDRVMIAGDHIIEHISSNAFIEPPQNQSGSRPLTLIQYRTALEMCADKEIEIIFSGHGVPVTNHREKILERLQKNWLRTDKLRSFLKDGEKTAYELTTLLFPNAYKKELALTLSETLGHIDLLRILHQIEVKRRNGVLYYSL
ncbi:MBL fold metallo-hydrolase [Mesobacillus maritimus]|uniref:MBL fold metallo-hydrolase n=1 Tax=Mesobacillus maritimus TaxID=1643336 RepID=UPI00203CE152|nr:MBL fold metallo-hydrolase [Mesobacillus maritimus]MCM3671055.1 MBL fold metallo-hydrolase [Mesobacillus maritimus]